MLPSTPPRADARPAPGLCAALDAADDLVKRLQANLADLAGRVSGLLVMATPAPPAPELAAVPSVHAEITDRVYRLNEGIHGAILMVTDLFDRLEI